MPQEKIKNYKIKKLEGKTIMGYSISLVDNKENVLSLTHPHQEGSVLILGGSNFAEMSVTYNYSRLFKFRELDGITALESIPILEEKVREFGTNRAEDYWEPTRGNVGYICNVLLGWAKEHPKGIWYVE